MKKPLTLLTLTLAGLLLAPAMRAADPAPEKPERGPRQTPAERVKMMKENLGLTDEQTEKIKAIFEKNRDKFKETRESTAGTQEERRAKMMEMRKAEMEEVRAILTPEQQEKAKEMREHRREKQDEKK